MLREPATSPRADPDARVPPSADAIAALLSETLATEAATVGGSSALFVPKPPATE